MQVNNSVVKASPALVRWHIQGHEGTKAVCRSFPSPVVEIIFSGSRAKSRSVLAIYF